jgi:pyridoxamine 5'-phosphate oxidase
MKKLQSHIKSLRNDFLSDKLDERLVSKSPFLQFEKWLQVAVDSGITDPNAMTLATVSKEGFPDARIVLLRDFTLKGFSFFTNYNSIKGKEIRYNKKACLNFYWPELARQIRLKGSIEKLSKRESDLYFDSRPRESQVGAWASNQSSVLENRVELENRYKALEEKYKGKKIPRPPYWGGYLLKPVSFEFWQGQPSRLHDRITYLKGKNGKWKIQRLNP